MGIVSLIVWGLGFGQMSSATVIEVSFKVVRTETCAFMVEGPTSKSVKQIRFSEVIPTIDAKTWLRYAVDGKKIRIEKESPAATREFFKDLKQRALALKENAVSRNGESSQLTLVYSDQMIAYAKETVTWDVAILFGDRMAKTYGPSFSFEAAYELRFQKGSWDALLRDEPVEMVPTKDGEEQLAAQENEVTAVIFDALEKLEANQGQKTQGNLQTGLDSAPEAPPLIHLNVKRFTQTEPVQRIFTGTLSNFSRNSIFTTISREITEVIH